MITIGEVKNVYYDDDTLMCDVDITLLKTTMDQKSNSSLTSSVYSATVCTQPGIYMSYNVGDIVYIEFYNNDITTPVVIGKVHKKIPDSKNSSSYGCLKSLTVTDKVALPENTVIGDIDYTTLKSLVVQMNNIKTYLQSIISKIDDISVSNSAETLFVDDETGAISSVEYEDTDGTTTSDITFSENK